MENETEGESLPFGDTIQDIPQEEGNRYSSTPTIWNPKREDITTALICIYESSQIKSNLVSLRDKPAVDTFLSHDSQTPSKIDAESYLDGCKQHGRLLKHLGIERIKIFTLDINDQTFMIPTTSPYGVYIMTNGETINTNLKGEVCLCKLIEQAALLCSQMILLLKSDPESESQLYSLYQPNSRNTSRIQEIQNQHFISHGNRETSSAPEYFFNCELKTNVFILLAHSEGSLDPQNSFTISNQCYVAAYATLGAKIKKVDAVDFMRRVKHPNGPESLSRLVKRIKNYEIGFYPKNKEIPNFVIRGQDREIGEQHNGDKIFTGLYRIMNGELTLYSKYDASHMGFLSDTLTGIETTISENSSHGNNDFGSQPYVIALVACKHTV